MKTLAGNKQTARDSARCRVVFVPHKNGPVNDRFSVMGPGVSGPQRTRGGNFLTEKESLLNTYQTQRSPVLDNFQVQVRFFPLW